MCGGAESCGRGIHRRRRAVAAGRRGAGKGAEMLWLRWLHSVQCTLCTHCMKSLTHGGAAGRTAALW